MDNRLLARLVRQHGGKLLDLAVDRLLPETAPAAPEAPKKKSSLTGKIASAALLRVATKSVPGAIIVTGGMLAKRAHDRRKAAKAKRG
jgi:DhnA family fructose-bisphosphate aldolase class Ia